MTIRERRIRYARAFETLGRMTGGDVIVSMSGADCESLHISWIGCPNTDRLVSKLGTRGRFPSQAFALITFDDGQRWIKISCEDSYAQN